MSKIKINLNNVEVEAANMDPVCKDIKQIGSSVKIISGILSMQGDSAEVIKKKLNVLQDEIISDAAKVSTLQGALREVAANYKRTEDEIVGKSVEWQSVMLSKKQKNILQKIYDWLREKVLYFLEKLGLIKPKRKPVSDPSDDPTEDPDDPIVIPPYPPTQPTEPEPEPTKPEPEPTKPEPEPTKPEPEPTEPEPEPTEPEPEPTEPEPDPKQEPEPEPQNNPEPVKPDFDPEQDPDTITKAQEEEYENYLIAKIHNLRQNYTEAQWNSSSPEQREVMLKNYLNEASEIMGVHVSLADWTSKPMENNSITMGTYYSGGDRIWVNTWAIANMDMSELMDTVTHELRHAYQTQAIRNPQNFRVSPETRSAWSSSFANYLTSDGFVRKYGVSAYEGYMMYRNQTVEVDARGFASATA